MNKKRNNKGFSLVELIVVIAVMAVLVVVLAPAYLRYVDKARVQKDESAVSEVVQAVKIAAAEEAVSAEIPAEVVVDGVAKAPTKKLTITIENGKTILVTNAVNPTKANELINETATALNSALGKEIRATVGDSVSLTSSTLKSATITITVYQDSNHNLVIETSDNIKLD